MRQEDTGFRLRSCVWEITLACCFQCSYCGSRAGTARANELTTDECLDVARQLADMGCRRVSMIGGEVFMRPDWPAIVHALTSRGVKVALITNGFLFSEPLIHQLKRLKVESVAISLDGPEQIHDAFRQKGSFARALRAIDTLTENDVPVSVISTLSSRNVPFLDETYEVLKDKKLFAWQLQACSPMGNAASFPTHIDFGEVIRFIQKHLEQSRFAIGAADNIGYYTEAEERLRGNAGASFLGCRAGLSSIGIDSVGNVRGCESMYDDFFIEGNLRERTLWDIWNDPEAFSYNRRFTTKALSGGCAQCRYGSRCAGGCRSYNYFSCGKLYESPCCARIPSKWKSDSDGQ